MITNVEVAEKWRDRLHNVCGSGKYGILFKLAAPPAKTERLRITKVRQWYQSLPEDGKQSARDLMNECADMCLFATATMLDGAHMLAENVYFELRLHDGAEARVITTGADGYRGEYFHDVVAEILQRDPRAGSLKPE